MDVVLSLLLYLSHPPSSLFDLNEKLLMLYAILYRVWVLVMPMLRLSVLLSASCFCLLGRDCLLHDCDTCEQVLSISIQHV
jgi:hypothetical protein